MQFQDLSLSESILRAVAEEGYDNPTPVQEAAIPLALEGSDIFATAQTGTGKTAAFSLPILQHLADEPIKGNRPIRALVLAPTRELALQIEDSFRNYGRHLSVHTAVVLGGVSSEPQIKALRRGVDVVVATPGRLLDLHKQGHAKLDRVQVLVLDEADRMLDMGFAPDVRRIVGKLPRNRQTMLFSATLSSDIAKLSADILRNPSAVEITPPASVSTNIAQSVMFVEQEKKRDLLREILNEEGTQRALVFTRTKHRANRVVKQLINEGFSADAIHSNKSQNARQRALDAFHRGRIKVLVATDIAARGIDVEGISHVINYEIPDDPESYVHRIGRTARAGSIGKALSFCNADEVSLLGGIERLTRSPLVPIDDHPFHSASIALMHADPTSARASALRARGSRPNSGARGSRPKNGEHSSQSNNGARASRSNDRARASRSGNVAASASTSRAAVAPRSGNVAAAAPRSDRPRFGRRMATADQRR